MMPPDLRCVDLSTLILACYVTRENKLVANDILFHIETLEPPRENRRHSPPRTRVRKQEPPRRSLERQVLEQLPG